jgi:MFS transporter, DHA3 family, macrolide efflux protein
MQTDTSPTSSITPATDIQGPWRLRFWSIWLGQAFSLVGSSLTQFLLIWWITLNTDSTSALAIAGMMALLPQALLSPLGGIFADRYSRRAIMIITDAISAACMLLLIWLFQSDQIQLWHLYTMMFIRSSMQAFQAPAAAASTSMLVPSHFLERAAGLNQLLQGIMTIAAAPLGALLLAFMPLENALFVDVATAITAILPLFFYAIPQQRTSQHTSYWADFVGGVRVVIHNRGLLYLYMLLALVIITLMPTFTLTPMLVKNHFGGGVNEVAFMEGLAGIGIIAGGLLIAVVPLFKRRIVTVLASFAISCAAVALTAVMPGSMLWLAAIWWGISGITFSTGNAPLMAILQTQVPNQLQGRVLALLNMIMGIAAPIGLGLAALGGELVGVRGIFIIGGTLATIVCLLAFALPALLHIEEATIQA